MGFVSAPEQKYIVLGMVTDCLKLEKSYVTHENPNPSPQRLTWEPTHKIRERREKFLKFSPDNKITSNFPQTTK